MNVQINAVGFSVAAPLHAYVNEKIGKLDKYNDQIISMEVFLKLEKDDNAENKVVEVKVDVKGGPIFAEKNGSTFEEAVDIIADVVKRQLVKVKEKIKSK
ncbi:MAG: ribosome-associated translation inhibitor RaiA [Marinifilaceae bacterium]